MHIQDEYMKWMLYEHKPSFVLDWHAVCAFENEIDIYVHLYFCPSDELSIFQLIFIVRSYVVLLFYCPMLGEGWNPAKMFNPAILCMYVSVPS